MVLLFLAAVLIGPYLVLSAADRWVTGASTEPATRAKVGVTLFFLVTASAHYTSTAAMAEMLPPVVPFRREIILFTGVLEILGAVGIWAPGLARPVGLCLILMLVGLLPANVYSALARVPYGGHDAGPVYLLVRVPFQLLVIGWVYWATRQRWLGARAEPARAADRRPARSLNPGH